MPDPRQPPIPDSRQSYFREGPMEEYTPTNSMHERSLRARTRGWRQMGFWTNGKGRLRLRVLNAVFHLGLCCMLLAIMVEFMVRYRGGKQRCVEFPAQAAWALVSRAIWLIVGRVCSHRPQVIVLVTLVAVDCCLDLNSVTRARRKWQGWALFLRFLLALGYLAQFLLYVSFRRVFPRQYAFWGMNAGYSDPVVYLLLWVIGYVVDLIWDENCANRSGSFWNLLHTTIHRHTLGKDLCRYVNLLRTRRRRADHVDGGIPRNSSPSAVSRVPSGHGGSDTPARVEQEADLEMTVALAEIHSDDKPTVTNLDRTSFTYEDPPQIGILARIGNRTTSRRASTAMSVSTLRVDGGADDVSRVDSKARGA